MSLTDPIADALTRLRNALSAKHSLVILPKSGMILRIVKILKDEGFIEDFITKKGTVREEIHIALKYDNEGLPIISSMQRVSKPGCRVYCRKDQIPDVLGGLGIAILSTSKGIMTSKDARQGGLGGEVLCVVS